MSAAFGNLWDQDIDDLEWKHLTFRAIPTIYMLDGMVLHPWAHYLACINLGTQPTFEEFTWADPIRFLAEEQFHRAVPLTAHRALIVVRMCAWERRGRPTVKPDNLSAFLDEPPSERAVDDRTCTLRRTEVQMGKLAKADPRTIRRAKAVYRHGLDELVLSGAMRFSEACDEASRKKASGTPSSLRRACKSETLKATEGAIDETNLSALQRRIDDLERDIDDACAERDEANRRAERAAEALSQESQRADDAEARARRLEQRLEAAGISTDATEPVQLSLTGYSSARASEIHTPTESQ